MQAMMFKLPRNRTISSTCGISIEFKKNQFHLVPPDMFEEVLAAGGISEKEILEEDLPKRPDSPAEIEQREQAMFEAFEKIVLHGQREDFTAGNVPQLYAIQRYTKWPVMAKERDEVWEKFQQLERNP